MVMTLLVAINVNVVVDVAIRGFGNNLLRSLALAELERVLFKINVFFATTTNVRYAKLGNAQSTTVAANTAGPAAIAAVHSPACKKVAD